MDTKNRFGFVMNNEKPLTNLILFASLGTVFWLEALLFIRFWGEHLFTNGNPWLLFLFASSVPIAWILVKISATIGKVEGGDLLTAVALISLTAMLLDGIALTWFQNWYGLEQTQLLLASAWILWGAGVGLAIGYWESLRCTS